jgi:hypothetical protein
MTGAPTIPADLDARFAALGVAIVEHALTADDLGRMDAAFPTLPPGTGGARTADIAPADVAWFGRHATLTALATRLGDGRPMALTRVLAFDKTAAANWFVPWHQDRADEHGERPVALLARMVSLRVHLDDCEEEAGPLEVLPGSHMGGRLDAAAIARLAATTAPLLCLAVRGDILALRPLLVHRSQRARRPRRRRVLHLDYLPSPRVC